MDTSPRIREAVKIIIERMKTNPEEFEGHGRFAWASKVDVARCGFTKAEARALEMAQREMQYQRFHKAVLEAMLDDNHGRTLKYSTENRYSFGWTDARQIMEVQGNSLKPSK